MLQRLGASLVKFKSKLAGAIERILSDKLMDTVSVKDFGAKGDGVTKDTASFIAAASAVREGGKILVPSGDYLVDTIISKPVSFIGEGQGSSVLIFDNSAGMNDGIVFTAPTKQDVEFGCSHLSIRTSGGHGRNAIYTPRGAGLNALRLKPTFAHLSFYSESTNEEYEGFSQKYSWLWAFNCGDSWQFTIDRIDAVGSYQAKLPYTSQFLDGFIRTAPEEGILSMRVMNITSHNIANFFEIQKKTYFVMTNVDCARALRGIYDAPDRVFETNRYAYGECICTNLGINAQLEPIRLDNRFLLVVNGGFIHRAANAHDHGREWVGINLTRPRLCTFQGVEIGVARGYTGRKVGLRLDAGDANNFSNISFGLLDVGIEIGKTGSTYGANHATKINNLAIHSDVTTMLNLISCRKLSVCGYSGSSQFTLGNFVTNADPNTNTATYADIDGYNLFTENSIILRNSASNADSKQWRIDTRNGYTMATQTDTGAAGDNALIMARTGTKVDRIELRTKAEPGGYAYINAPEVHVGGTFKPSKANVYDCGTAGTPWRGGYTQVAFTITSDMRVKRDITPLREMDALLDAWSEVDWYQYRLMDDNELHMGVMAQEILAIFQSHGLDATKYGIVQYNAWEDQYNDEGELVLAAGDLYTVNYSEAQALECAMLRRELKRVKDATDRVSQANAVRQNT